MTHAVDYPNGTRVVVLEEEEPQECELCGAFEETRPYGPHGEEVCYDCGMKNPEAVKAAYDKLFGPDPEAVKVVYPELIGSLLAATVH